MIDVSVRKPTFTRILCISFSFRFLRIYCLDYNSLFLSLSFQFLQFIPFFSFTTFFSCFQGINQHQHTTPIRGYLSGRDFSYLDSTHAPLFVFAFPFFRCLFPFAVSETVTHSFKPHTFLYFINYCHYYYRYYSDLKGYYHYYFSSRVPSRALAHSSQYLILLFLGWVFFDTQSWNRAS